MIKINYMKDCYDLGKWQAIHVFSQNQIVDGWY